MGVDFYVYDAVGYENEKRLEGASYEDWKENRIPEKFYVRESYHGCTHAVGVFCPESYDRPAEDCFVVLNWEKLLKRMPDVAEACIQRDIDYMKKEAEDGTPFPRLDGFSYGLAQLKIFIDIVEFVRAEDSEGRKVYAYNSY